MSYQGSGINTYSTLGLARTATSADRYERVESSRQQRARTRTKGEVSHPPYEIWGRYNNYRSDGVAVSAVAHLVVIGLLLATAATSHPAVAPETPRQVVTLIAPSPDTYTLPAAPKEVSGGGGGGDHDILPAPKGELPKPAMQQITPPAMVVRNENPRLAVQPTVVIPPQVHLAENHLPNFGNYTGAVLPAAPPSNGTGAGGGIGSGSAAGVGEGHGPGVGSGSGGGFGGGVFHVGGGISAPQAISAPEPDYTDEARKAKTEGTCILGLIVDTEGRPRDIHVVRGIGSGLEAKAIEAVQKWRFQPAKKDGKPVNVQISVEVSFRLY